MKSACCLLFLLAVLVLTGCGKDDKSSTTTTTVAPVSPAPPPGPTGNGYLGTMMKAQQAAIKTIDVTALNQEIQLFNVQEGRLPKDLNELVTKQYIGAIPAAPVGMKLVYDPVEGKVTTARQ